MNIILESSYYILKSEKVIFYDIEGNQLKLVLLNQGTDNVINVTEHFGGMLDPNCTGKTRPTRIVINHHSKLGRIIQWCDKNENIIYYYRYDGPATHEAIISNEREKHAGRFDLDWIKENKIPISDISYQSSCKIL